MSWHYIDTASLVWSNDATTSNSNQIDNATEMWNFFRYNGYSEQAISAIIGNAQYESTLNPAQWEYGGYVGNMSQGYGLFQWTPATRYINTFCGTYGYDRKEGHYQCAWVQTQTIGGLDGNQWSGVVPPYAWGTFKTSQESPSNLAYAFCRNWERGGWNNLRATNAEYWYSYFTGTPTPPDPPEPPGPPDPPEPPTPIYGSRTIPVWLMVKIIQDKQQSNGKKLIDKGYYMKW